MWSYISLFLYCPSVSYATNIFFSFKIIHRYRYNSSQDGQSRRGNVFKKGNVIECSFILFRWHFHRVTRITSDFLQRWILSAFCLFLRWNTVNESLFLYSWGEGKEKKSDCICDVVQEWKGLPCQIVLERMIKDNNSLGFKHFFPPSIYGAKIHLLLQSLKKINKICDIWLFM